MQAIYNTYKSHYNFARSMKRSASNKRHLNRFITSPIQETQVICDELNYTIIKYTIYASERE